MPTNLPPDYFSADKRFREAETTQEKIACLEEMYSLVPKHKGTDHLRADLRRQLSRLKEEAQSKKKGAGHASVYYVAKEGAGQAALLGAANTGKSALLAALTRAAPEVSPAPYTTRKPVPGMLLYENIQIQLVDTPSLGRGITEPGLFDLARRADILLVVVDIQDDPLGQLEESLALLAEHRIRPLSKAGEPDGEERIVYRPVIVLANKCDSPEQEVDFQIFRELCASAECPPMLPVSAQAGQNFASLGRLLYETLGVIRVFAKPPGKPPDLERPFVIKKGATIGDLAGKVHRDFVEKLKFARVWGSSAFDGQMVQHDYVLYEGDIVEFRA